MLLFLAKFVSSVMKQWVVRHWKSSITVIAAFVLLVGIGIRCRDIVVCRIVEYYLKSTGVLPGDLTVRCSSSSMNFRELRYGMFQVTSSSDPQFAIIADECAISFFSKPRSLYPYPHVTFTGLDIALPSSPPSKKGKGPSIKWARSLNTLGSFLTIESGVLHVNRELFLPFAFTHTEEGHSFVINHVSEGYPLCTLMMKQHGRALELKAQCHEFDMRVLSSLLATHGINLKQGVLDGKFKGVLQGSNSFEKIAYGFSIRKLSAEIGAFHVGASEVFSYRSLDNLGSSFFDAEWQLADCFVNKKEGDGKCIYLIKDVRANIPSRSGELLTVKGAMRHRGGFHPFLAQGIRNIGDNGTELEVKLTSDPLQMTFDLDYSKEGSGSLKCDFSECDAFLVESFVRDTVLPFVSRDVEIPVVKQGFFSGSAYAHLYKWEVDTLEVEQLSLEKFVLEMDQIPGGVLGDELQCFFRYAGGSFPSWGVHLQNVSFPMANLTGCSGDFAIHERYVIPSTIHGTIDTMSLKASVRGVLPSVKLSIETSGGSAPLLNTLSVNHSFTAEELASLHSLSLKTTILMHDHAWNMRGAFSVFSLPAIPPKDERRSGVLKPSTSSRYTDLSKMYEQYGFSHSDKIDFQCTLMKPEKWSAQNLQEVVQEITFSGKETSSLLLNLPLGIAKQPWRLRGKTSFEGGITRQGLHIQFKQPAVSFHSPVLQVEAMHAQDEASLAYTFDEKKWKGSIPISDTTIALPRLGLQFTNGSGDVAIEGKEIYIKTMSARYADLQVEGRMAVHFPEENDDVNIELITTSLHGQVETLQSILSHFEDFKDVAFPIKGTVTQEEGKGLRLKASLAEENDTLHWGADLRIIDGTYPLSDRAAVEQLALDIEWDGTSGDVAVGNMSGVIHNPETSETYTFKEAKCTLKNEVLNSVSLLLDNGTYDILSVQADVVEKEGVYTILFDKEQSHIYSIPLKGSMVSFRKGYDIEECIIDAQGSIRQLQRVLSLANLLDFGFESKDISPLLATYSIKAEPVFHLDYNRAKKTFHLEGRSEEITCNGKQYGPGHFIVTKNGEDIEQCSLELPSLSAKGRGEWKGNEIIFNSLELKRNKAYAKMSTAHFDFQTKKLHCLLDKLYIKLEELQNDIPSMSDSYREYLTGALTCTGEVNIDFSRGYKKPVISGHTDIIAPKIGKGNLQLVTHHPVSFEMDLEKGLVCDTIELLLSTLENEEHWAQIECAHFTSNFMTGDCKAEGARVLIPPEMFLFIARTESIPYIFAGEKSLKIYGVEIPWENQVDITASIEYSQGILTCSGAMKDGYYWVGNTSLFVSGVTFSLGKDAATCSAHLDAYDKPVAMTLEASFFPSLSARLVVEDRRPPEQRLHDSHTTVTALFSEDALGKVNLKSIQGGIYGVDVAFQQQAQRTTDSELVLSGKIRCHMPYVATVLPHEWQELINTIGMGQGYEISGDMILNWDDLHSSTFSGYIKGKNFELLNARIQTLMGTLRITKKEFSIDRFIISDEAGQLTINEIQCMKGDDNKWRLSIPQIVLQDFRPSLLRHIGKYRGRMKPFVIRELYFNDITGELGNLQSFTGAGDLAFTNTFKKEYNLLDIPFELIARLGIDMGLLVPVRGKLKYEIRDGKIYLTELAESCSEGKRSKFYLSKTSPSYISLQGDINVSIKMRQYVILKVTEPFILSITGTLKKPKYSLR